VRLEIIKTSQSSKTNRYLTETTVIYQIATKATAKGKKYNTFCNHKNGCREKWTGI